MRRAFTLIETLIVIAVVAIMVAILSPSLSGARESARKALCISNLRQLQWANDAYAGDHLDRYCPGAADFSRNLERWHGARNSMNAPFSAAAGRGSLTVYLADGAGESAAAASVALRVCPTFVPTQLAIAASGAGFERSAGGYGYNNAFVGTDRSPAAGAEAGPLWIVCTDVVGSSRSRFESPTTTLAFGDAALADGNPATTIIEYSFMEPRFWPETSPAVRPDPSVHFRHAQRANSVWLDGHISSERRSFSIRSSVYDADPALSGIGWFGTADDNSLFDYR